VQAGRVGLEHPAVGAAEAERVEVLHGRVAWHVEQEPAAVAGVSAAPFGRFQDQDAAPGVVGGDGRGGPGRAVPGDHHVRHSAPHTSTVSYFHSMKVTFDKIRFGEFRLDTHRCQRAAVG
jgi:hypothetical protein